MAELTVKEKLQPSLLDRLTDAEPEKTQEARDQRVLSTSKLRDCVMRDLSWLLNSANLASTEDLEKYPMVAQSVVNYGLPDLAGKTASGMDIGAVERAMRQVIWDFEPRILRNTVRVRAIRSDDQFNLNALAFDIEGELWAQPVPMQLYVRTELDLDTGSVTVRDQSGAVAG